ncbi:nickel transporter [Roseateles noduli]|nr:nickel transporter [Roseateles noduli]
MSLNRFQKIGLLLTPLLLCAGAAQAHSPYLKPNTFTAEEQRKHVTVEASFAEGDLRPDVAMKSETFQVIGPDGKTLPLTPAAVLKDASYLEVPLGPGNGTYLVSSGVRKGRLAKGVLREGKVVFSERAEDAKPGDKPIEVQSITRADVYVTRGRPTTADFDMEGVGIYPVTQPYDLYAGSPVKVLVREPRKALAGETVTVIADGQNYVSHKQPEQDFTTNAAGEVSFTPKTAGLYLLQVRVRRASPDNPALWISTTATLTIEVQPQP